MISALKQRAPLPLDPKFVKRILIIQTAFIGDVVLTTPLIRETKRAFPNAHIDILVTPQTRNVLENNPHLHSIFVFEKKSKKIKAFVKTAWLIRKKNYDLCFAAHRSMTTAWLMIFGGVKNRIGFTGKSAARLMSRQVTFRQEARQIERYLDLLRLFKTKELNSQSELFFNEHILFRAQQLLSPLPANRPVLAIAPGSVRPTKRWPEERFVQLINQLPDEDINIILIGSPGEKPLCDRIEKKSGGVRLLNLAGETTLLEAAALIKSCNLLICNDSGTMHIANAVKTDVFAFFGPTVEWLGFSPFRANDKIFQVDIDCRPCSTHGGESCPKGHFRCMLDISVDRVRESVLKRLQS